MTGSRRGTEPVLSSSLGKDSVLSAGGGGFPVGMGSGGVTAAGGPGDITMPRENMTTFEELQVIRSIRLYFMQEKG